MFLSVYAYDSPCVLHPPMASKDGVYRYLKFAVLTIHFTSKEGKSMWDSDIPHNFQFGLHVQCRSQACYRSLQTCQKHHILHHRRYANKAIKED